MPINPFHFRQLRSFRHRGKLRSIALEAAFWESLEAVAIRERVSVDSLLRQIHDRRRVGNFTSAVRCFVVAYFRAATPADVANAAVYAAALDATSTHANPPATPHRAGAFSYTARPPDGFFVS